MIFPPALADRIRQAIAAKTEELPPTGPNGIVRRRKPSANAPTFVIAPFASTPPRRGWNTRTLTREVEATFREAQHEHRT